MSANKERLQLLVNALMSGEYAQTSGYLKRTKEGRDTDSEKIPAGYCCLGVGCEISGTGKWVDQEFGDNAIYVTNDGMHHKGAGLTSEKFEGPNSPYYMPRPVSDWFELDHKDIKFSWTDRSSDGQARASSMNDIHCTFAQIAECIAYEFGLELPVAVAA